MYFLGTLPQERSVKPPFRAEALPWSDGKHVFVFTKSNSKVTKPLQMKVKLIEEHGRDCPSEDNDSSSADEVRYTDFQEIAMLTMNGGITTHRHILGHLIEC